MKHRLPYVCVPAGTRNHLALDLGLDRDDVAAGALDAYTAGIDRTIDLATVKARSSSPTSHSGSTPRSSSRTAIATPS